MPAVAQAFETISHGEGRPLGRGVRATSAISGKTDEIIMNRDRLLADAKAKALALAEDYKPPAASEFHLPGPAGKAALHAGGRRLRAAGQGDSL